MPSGSCSKAKARITPYKSQRTLAPQQGGAFLCGPAMRLGYRKYVMICADIFPRFKIAKFLEKSDAPSTRSKIIAEYLTFADLKIGSI